HFIAVTMAFGYLFRAINPVGQGARFYGTFISAQAHGAAHGLDGFLLCHEIDHWVDRLGFHLGGMGVFQTADISGEFNNGYLHPAASAEVGNVIPPGDTGGCDFSFDPARAESAWI